MQGRVKEGLIAALVTVSVVAAATVGVVIWQFVREAEVCDDEDDLQKLFPGYFRTASEQERFISMFKNATRAPNTVQPQNCSFRCPAKFNMTTLGGSVNITTPGETVTTASETVDVTTITTVTKTVNLTTLGETVTTVGETVNTTIFGTRAVGTRVVDITTVEKFVDITTPANNSGTQRRRKRDSESQPLPSLHEEMFPDRVRYKRTLAADDVIVDGPVYHACCATWRVETSPRTALTDDATPVEVELVQTDRLKQYFEQERCRYDNPCYAIDCSCQTIPYVSKAVVYRNRNARRSRQRYKVARIVLDGCCKCLNLVKN